MIKKKKSCLRAENVFKMPECFTAVIMHEESSYNQCITYIMHKMVIETRFVDEIFKLVIAYTGSYYSI